MRGFEPRGEDSREKLQVVGAAAEPLLHLRLERFFPRQNLDSQGLESKWLRGSEPQQNWRRAQQPERLVAAGMSVWKLTQRGDMRG